MSAARVLNPAVFSEICMVRGLSTLPCERQAHRIQRNLFGCANPVETNKIFHEELEKHQETAIKKWGFDFRTGSPLTSNSQYIWERVAFAESSYAPDVYTLTRAAHIRPTPAQPTSLDLLMDERADRENYVANLSASSATDTDSCDESLDELSPPSVVFKVPANVTNRNASATFNLSCRQLRKRQPKITEYMKERKRLAQTPKKPLPAKRMRTNSGGSSSSIGSGYPSHAVNPHSIASHFSLRSHQRHH